MVVRIEQKLKLSNQTVLLENNTISNHIELRNNSEAIKEGRKVFLQQQALTTFLTGLHF